MNRPPRLRPGCRLGPPGILLAPERVVLLKGAAERILQLCDGQNTINEMVKELSIKPSESIKIEKEILAFLEKLQMAGLIEEAPL